MLDLNPQPIAYKAIALPFVLILQIDGFLGNHQAFANKFFGGAYCKWSRMCELNTLFLGYEPSEMTVSLIRKIGGKSEI